ncbi:MAG: hypothetical protein ACU841_14730 [Gammaproteobacteria bacterium]
MASAATEYPASDFQPKVVYQDPEYKHAGISAGSSSSAPSVSDSQYPAANFQPKVVYNDPEYKHAQGASTGSPSLQKPVEGSSSSSSSVSTSEPAKAEESSSNYLIGLVVLALVAFVLFRKKSQPESRESTSGQGGYRVSSGSSSGLTGVAKYINRKAGTGVSRYLEQQVKSAASSSAATGVARYMAKQSEAVKTSASQAATGVEKYMRNRG